MLMSAWTSEVAHAAPYRGRVGGYHNPAPRGGVAGRQIAQPGRVTLRRPLGAKPRATTAKPKLERRLAKAPAISSTATAPAPAPARRSSPFKEFLRGIASDGPKHMWHSMVQRPAIFFGGLLAVGTLGGLGAAFDIHTEPTIIAASITALGLQLWTGVKAVRGAPRESRARVAGAELAFPTLVWAGSSAAAFGLGHGPSSNEVAPAAAKAMLFGGEAPANLSMARGHAPADFHQ